MPRGPIPVRFDSLPQRTAVGHLATIRPEGVPQVNPVQFIWDGRHLLPRVKAEAHKERNLRQNPSLATSIVGLANPHHYFERRSAVRQFDRYRTLDFVHRLSGKYPGQPVNPEEHGQERYRLTVEIDSWSGQ